MFSTFLDEVFENMRDSHVLKEVLAFVILFLGATPGLAFLCMLLSSTVRCIRNAFWRKKDE